VNATVAVTIIKLTRGDHSMLTRFDQLLRISGHRNLLIRQWYDNFVRPNFGSTPLYALFCAWVVSTHKLLCLKKND